MVKSAVSTANIRVTKYSDKHQQQDNEEQQSSLRLYNKEQREADTQPSLKAITRLSNPFYDKRIQLKIINQQAS